MPAQESSRYAGLALIAFVAAILAWNAFGDWNAAPEVPMSGGIGGVSLLRIAAIAALMLLLVAMLAALARKTLTEISGGSRAVLELLIASLVGLAAALEATGKLREAVIAWFGRVPGGPTRMQVHKQAIAQFEAQERSWAGKPQPLEYFAGGWSRDTQLMRHQVRIEGERAWMRIFLECAPGNPPCEAGETEARVSRGDGGVSGIAATVTTDFGRVWAKLVPGRYPAEPALAMTHAIVEGPEWQMSSGTPVVVSRERKPVPRAAYVGDWQRLRMPAREGEMTRLSVRSAGGDGLSMQAWMQCGPRECDLGAQSATVETEGGMVRIARAVFSRENRELAIALEPPAGDRAEALSEASLLRYTTTQMRRGGTHTYVSGRNSSNTRVELRRAGG